MQWKVIARQVVIGLLVFAMCRLWQAPPWAAGTASIIVIFLWREPHANA